MDPIQININVTLGLNDKAVELLQAIVGKTAQAPVPETKPSRRKVETKPAQAPETKEPQPDSKPAEEPTPQERPVDDLPFGDNAAQAPMAPETESSEITDEELRAVIIRVRKATPTAASEIRNVIFPEFGIKTSIECPQERRAELVARLEKLVA